MAINQPIKQKGYIFAYFEQGWEGRIDFAFHSEEQQTFIILETGDKLTLFNKDNAIVFQDELKFVKRRCWDKHNLNADIWSFVKQSGIPYAKWMQWFWQKPNLSAELIKSEVVK